VEDLRKRKGDKMGINGKRLKKYGKSLFRKKSLKELQSEVKVHRAKLQREKLKSEISELRRQRMLRPIYRKEIKATPIKKKKKKKKKGKKRQRAVFYFE
jgi:hypothetical protein